jgi:hypothetical protein
MIENNNDSTLSDHIKGGGDPSEIPGIVERHGGLNYKDERNGDTPLMLAVKNGDFASANVLLELGANPYIRNDEEDGRTVLDFALQGGNFKILKLLIPHNVLSPSTLINYMGNNNRASFRIFKLLIESYVFDFETPDRHGHNIQNYAALNGERFVVFLQGVIEESRKEECCM